MGIGIRIRECRRYAGLTQEELAKMLGYADKTSISNIENEKYCCPMTVAKQMAEIFECDFNWLWNGNEKDENLPTEAKPSQKDDDLMNLARLTELEQAMLTEFKKLGTMDKIKAINFVQELNNKK